MSTYRERRERRVERLRDWGDKRQAKAQAEGEKADAIAGMIPLGQPVLKGHHSQRRHERDLDRIRSASQRSAEHGKTARRHAEKARNIEAQLERSVYSDDDDAVDRLRERIVDLEGQRDRIKAYNRSCRKGERDPSLLDDKQRATLESVARVAPYQLGKRGEMPGYALSNLSGNIARNRKRLEALERGGR